MSPRPYLDGLPERGILSGEDAEPGRERMLRLGLYQLGERLTLVERELLERLEALERRDA